MILLKVNISDSFTSVKYWDVLIYNHLLKKKIVIPQKTSHKSKGEKYVGAYVKEPQVGQHKWVMSFDLNSLYPHLIMQYNISPETLMPQEVAVDVDYLLDNKPPSSLNLTTQHSHQTVQSFTNTIKGFCLR